MTDFDSFGSSGIPADVKEKDRQELQEFIMMEKQKAQLNAQVYEFNSLCWEKCVEKPSSRLDKKTETCLTNCVDRFIDVSVFITERFAQMLQKSAGGL